MSDDWTQIKARLEARCSQPAGELYLHSDIRAALQRVEELEQHQEARQEWRSRMGLKTTDQVVQENAALRQRVEELELERDSARELFLEADAARNEVVALRQRVEELERENGNARSFEIIERQLRESAEAKLARVVKALENAKGRSPGLVPDLLAALAAAKEE